MGIDVGQKKLAAAIILGTLALCALLLARGATSIAAAYLFPAEVTAASRANKKTLVAPAAAYRAPDMTEILKRNVFDSKTGPLWPPPETVQAAEQAEPEEDYVPDPNAPPPPCESALKLRASVYSESLPEWSFAAISTGSGAPLLYQQGRVVEGSQILAIYPSAVFLKPEGGRPCSLALFLGSAKPAAAAPGAPLAAERAPTPLGLTAMAGEAEGFSKQELDQNIKRVSDTEYSVTREMVDKVLANQAALMRSARIVPHEVDGKVVGVKLYGIRRNSLLGQLGLQNGDLMRAINGYDMTSPDRALEAYSKLRSTDSLTVAVQRRGSNLNMNYKIR